MGSVCECLPLAGGGFSQGQFRDTSNNRGGHSNEQESWKDEKRKGKQHLDREAFKAFFLDRIGRGLSQNR